MHTTVDKVTCIACGVCTAICPKVFETGDDGKPYVVDQKGDSDEKIIEAKNACPIGSIYTRD